MKKVLITIITIGLLLLPSIIYAQPDQRSTGPPPVAQPLVREGDLAVKLVGALKIGTAKDEAEAETMLGSFGIAPKNGWIADYPVTPDVVGELEKAVSEAADAKKLPMGKQEALKVFRTATVEAGIPIVAEVPGKYAESQPPESYEYTSPEVVNNYYYDEGPPVITYYPPPWDYWYLYSWVPCPFFFRGFFFSGFFALHDFHRVVIFANRVVVVSNHVISPINRTVVVIDPPTRATGRTLTSGSATGKTITSTSALQRTGTAGFTSANTRKAATSILERSQQRLGTGSVTRMTGQTSQFRTAGLAPSTTSRTMGPNQRQTPNTIINQRSSGGGGRSVNAPNVFNGRSSGVPSSTASLAPSTSSRTMGTNQGRTPNTAINQRSSGGGGRSVNTPNVFNGGSSGRPSMSRTFGSSGNSARSFSRPSGSFSPPSGSRSFGSSSAGHSSGGFFSGRGGFSGGHSFSGGFSSGGRGFHGSGRQ